MSIQFVIASLSASAGTCSSFPSSRVRLSSPDRKHVLVNRDDVAMSPPHSLMLLNVSTGQSWSLHAYLRHIKVCWSPDSKAIAITDYLGSNLADTYLFLLSKPHDKLDLLEQLRRQFPGYNGLPITHLYLELLRWEGPQTVLLSASIYGKRGHPEEEVFYRYQIGSGFRPLTSTRPSDKNDQVLPR